MEGNEEEEELEKERGRRGTGSVTLRRTFKFSAYAKFLEVARERISGFASVVADPL